MIISSVSRLRANRNFKMNSENITQKPVTWAQSIVVTGIPLVTITVNVPSIIMIIWILVRKEDFKNVHLLSSGITDMLVGVTAYLMSETYVQRTRTFQYFDCAIRFYLFSITFVASMLHVLGICLQRISIVLMKQTEQQHQTSRKFVEWIVITFSWTISFVVNLIPFSLWVREVDIEYCSFDTVHYGHEKQLNMYLGSLYAILIFMVLMSMCILLRLVHTRVRKDTVGSGGDVAMKMICITVCIMATLFVITTSPLATVLLLHESYKNKRAIRALVVLISLLNSAINPFVYLFRIKEHRNILKKIVCCSALSVCCRPASINIFIVSDIQTQTSHV